MRLIGTAGHVDHGKSSLVKRLTGIDPDRLQEEKSRGLTIDLGFAWMSLGDTTLGIVDVPGHRDFIENMLAGVGGIDIAILVIASDEGVMPQTREHLAILDLLGIQHGIVALTKVDLIDDPDWLDLIEQDVRDLLKTTSLSNAPIMRVSAHSGAGLDELVQEIQQVVEILSEHVNYNTPFLPVDRIFTVDGFGTVVTGTLSGGQLHLGDEVEIQPSGLMARVRGLQSYKQAVEVAIPGTRVAVNLAGVDKQSLQRGDVLGYEGQLKNTQLIDCYYTHLDDNERPLKHNAEVKFFCGATSCVARVRVLGQEMLQSRETGWIQLRLEDALPLKRSNRYILRFPSPAVTIGGGMIVNAHPEMRWKRFDPSVIQQLEIQLEGSPSERLSQLSDTPTPLSLKSLRQQSQMDETEFNIALDEALTNGFITALNENLYWSTERLQSIHRNIRQILADYHVTNRLRLGIQREELRSRLKLKQNIFNAIISIIPDVSENGRIIRLISHQIAFTLNEEKTITSVLDGMQNVRYTPPSFVELEKQLSADIIFALIELGHFIGLNEKTIFLKEAYQDVVTYCIETIQEQGYIDVKHLRDHFGTSRKYAIALLEYTDNEGITKRDGDVRILGIKANELLEN